MAASLVLCLLLANAASLLAVPIQNVDYIDFDELLLNFFNEDMNKFIKDNNVDALKNVQESSYECKNLYSHTCDKKTKTSIFSNHEFKQKTSEFYSTFKQKITDLLSNRDRNSGAPSVNLERQLYRRCMNLGSNDEESTIKYHDDDKLSYVTDTDENVRSNDIENEPVNQIFSKILKAFGHKNIFTKTWQQLDQKLAAIGFGHAFYDISVMADPYIPNKNIILLQPPSIKKWNSIKFIDTLSDIYVHFQIQLYEQCTENSSKTSGAESNESNLNDSDHESEDESEESSSETKANFNSDEGPAFLESDETKDMALASKSYEVNSLCKPYQSLSRRDVFEKIINIEDEMILVFFNRLLKAMFDSISATNKEDFYAKLTIKEWNKKYNSINQRATSKIDWFEVIKSEFEQVGITIDDTESIFIKNVPYFYKLAKYLKYHSNQIFDKGVRSKFIAENARYIDWDWMESVNPIDQSNFCFEQTQLYGVSQEALKSMKNDFSNPHVQIVATIMNNIAHILYRNISENVNLSDVQKTYMKAQLSAMTNHLLSNNYDTSDDHDSIFDDYYANFKATNDYFVDINMYRRTIKNSILKKLRDNTPLSYEYLPFDINEIENPRNRLVLYALSNVYIDSSKSPEFFNSSEKYYGTFGVKLAGFLYSLIVEDKFQTDVHDLHGSQWLNAHMTYSPRVVKCFVPENIVAYGYPLAYSTITEIFSVRIALEAMLNDSKVDSVHDFYKAYIESHCSAKEQKMMHKVLSNLAHVSTVFDCSDKSVEPKCDMSIFQS
ncbi:uncharacterized protein LOC100116438 [Nasonia vitripennis]|uniref:Uncharacterized protein n=1 Tax=Nasonia vitripennis TaxID=7425 RepID=A0A7M7IUA6_NASVI|nr:uncharacterized protein LOC100116438 [Nasonia vitripennis]